MTSKRIFTHIRRFQRCDSGAAVVEYGLIASLIVIAILVAVSRFADANDTVYNKVETAITEAHDP